MIPPLNDADLTKLMARYERAVAETGPFEISPATAGRLFAYVDDLKRRAAVAEERAASSQGHIDQAAADRDAAFARLEVAEKTLSIVRAMVRHRGPPVDDGDLDDAQKLRVFSVLRKQFGDKQMAQWPHQRDVANFYGNPDANNNGEPDAAWESANLERFTPPWKMVLAWDPSRPVSTIRMHKKVIPAVSGALQMIWTLYDQNQARIEEDRLHLFGGAYNFRLMRGSTKLSMHSYGIAIDIDPEGNPLGKAWKADSGMMPMAVVNHFEAAGATWGGRWRRPDSQHFQWAST